MGTTTPYMNLSIPTLNGDPGTWDTQVSASLTIIDTHTHQAGSGVFIRPGAIKIDGDLTFTGFSLTNLRAAVYTAQTSFTTALSTYVIGNDLYFRDGASNQVRLTASGALNMTTVGGIAGDYTSANANVYYDSAAKTYRFLETAPLPNVWNYVACSGVDLYEQGSGILTRVRLQSPAGLVASYVNTYPAALPASTSLFQITSAGVMTYSNTVVKAVTMTELTTFSAGATATAGQHFTVSAAGRFKHGTLTKNFNAQHGIGTSFNYADGYVVAAGAADWRIAIPFNEGERLQSYSFRHYGNGVATITYEVNIYDTSAGKTTLATTTITPANAAWGTESAGSVHTFAAGSCLVIQFTASAALPRLGNISLTYDRP